MFSTPLEDKITQLLEESLVADGFEIVLLRLKDGKRKTLELVVEREDGEAVTIDDCSDISHTVSAILDVEDPIAGAYQLEVSSPGGERPLGKLKDFERFAGRHAKLETMLPVEGRKRFTGQLKGVDGNTVKMEFEGEEMRFEYGNLRQAKLTLSEEDIRELLRDGKKKLKQGEAG